MRLSLHSSCYLLSGKIDWKLSKTREGLPASETSAGTKAGGRGMARAGEGARPSALRPLALQPLWWDNHGLHVAASAASQLPPPPPCLQSLSSSPSSLMPVQPWAGLQQMCGWKWGITFFPELFLHCINPPSYQLWRQKNNGRWGRQGHNQNHV